MQVHDGDADTPSCHQSVSPPLHACADPSGVLHMATSISARVRGASWAPAHAFAHRADDHTHTPAAPVAGPDVVKRLVLTQRHVVRGLTLTPGIHLPANAHQNTKPARGASHAPILTSPQPLPRQPRSAADRADSQPAPGTTAPGASHHEAVPTSLAGMPLSDAQLWARFCELQPEWPYLYAAYHHFRSKVRAGAALLASAC